MKHLKFNWICCALLLILAALAFFAPGYRFSSLFLTGLAALVPVYHLLGKYRARPLWKGVQTVLTVLLCVFFLAMAVTLGVLMHSGQGTAQPQSDFLVVLGAGVNGTVPSRSLQDRLDAALSYLETHPGSVAVVSGGQGDGEQISEAQCMANVLLARGIDSDRVWMEDQAENTLENLRFSLEVIEAHTGERPGKIAIVSSEYHLHRAGLFASGLGLEAELVPAETGRVLLRANYYLREIFAVWYYSIFGGIHHV